MVARIIFFIALVCTAKCNPLVQPTVCDTPGLLSTLIPGYGATLCESAPNVLPYMPYGLGSLGNLGLSTTVCDTPNLLSLGYGLPYAPLGATISATACESAPNVLGMGGIGYGMPVSPLGSATVYESAPTMTPNLLGLNHGPPCPMSGAVYENSPNVLGWTGMGSGGVGVGLGSLGLNGVTGVGGICPLSLGLGVGYPLPYASLGALGGVGSSTACESNPNLLGLGYYPGVVGVGLNGMAGLGMGANTLGSTTFCESAPNTLGLGLGFPCPRSFL